MPQPHLPRTARRRRAAPKKEAPTRARTAPTSERRPPLGAGADGLPCPASLYLPLPPCAADERPRTLSRRSVSRASPHLTRRARLIHLMGWRLDPGENFGGRTPARQRRIESDL